MQRVSLIELSGAHGLQLEEVDAPHPAYGEIAISAKACGVNFFECLISRGEYADRPSLPFLPGVEVAGIVSRVGPGVRGLAVGDRVAAPLFLTQRPLGGYAQEIVVSADHVIRVPDSVDDSTAVALLVQGLTALQAIRAVRPEGRAVLIGAAAGGLGSLLVQLVRIAGAKRIVAAVGRPDKVDFVRALGVEEVIVGREDLRCAPIDIAYDFVGGRFTASALGNLAESGELVFGALGRLNVAPDALARMASSNQTFRGLALLPSLARSNWRRDLGYLFSLVVEGKLRVMARTYPLARVREAYTAILAGATMGKIVLEP